MEKINSINAIINDVMKSFIKNYYLTLLLCGMAYFLVGCSNKENETESGNAYQQLYAKNSVWTINHEGDDDYDYDEYHFSENGVGKLLYFKMNGTTGSTSDYFKYFTYKIESDMLILDFGFGYILNYRLESISRDYLHLSLNGIPMLLTWRDVYHDEVKIPDFLKMIANTTWNIKDTEDKCQEYIISFHADGTYESKNYSEVYGTSFITETGKFEVQNSRVKFQSNSNGSLLNGRIFTITSGLTDISSSIDLETETGTKIKGTKC